MIVAMLAACAGGPEPTTWEAEVAPILSSNCTACHTGDDPSGGLDLSGDSLDIYYAIVEEPSTQNAEMNLVEPGDYLASYLWHKVKGTQSVAEGSGASMPVGGALDPAEIDAIALWIDAGAER